MLKAREMNASILKFCYVLIRLGEVQLQDDNELNMLNSESSESSDRCNIFSLWEKPCCGCKWRRREHLEVAIMVGILVWSVHVCMLQRLS